MGTLLEDWMETASVLLSKAPYPTLLMQRSCLCMFLSSEVCLLLPPLVLALKVVFCYIISCVKHQNTAARGVITKML